MSRSGSKTKLSSSGSRSSLKDRGKKKADVDGEVSCHGNNVTLLYTYCAHATLDPTDIRMAGPCVGRSCVVAMHMHRTRVRKWKVLSLLTSWHGRYWEKLRLLN